MGGRRNMCITQAWEDCHSCTMFKMFGKTKRRREQLLEKKKLRINEEMPTTKTLGYTKIIQLGNTEIHTHTHTYNVGRQSHTRQNKRWEKYYGCK
jgi:IS1 family transposase